MELGEAQVVRLGDRFLDPVPRRVHFEAVSRLGGDERALARVILNLEAEVRGALESAVVLLLFEGDAEVVNARDVPVPGLEHDVDRPPRDLDKPEPEAHAIELLPGGSRLEPVRALAPPAVAPDEREPELAQIARFEEPHLARHEVVVEQMHALG